MSDLVRLSNAEDFRRFRRAHDLALYPFGFREDDRALGIARQLHADADLAARVRWIMDTVDLDAVELALRAATDETVDSTPVPCAGGCGLIVTLVSGSCDECAAHAERKERRRLALRSIRSALARARAAGLTATLSNEEWQETLDHFGNACAYCGGQWYIVEHATSIALGGGTIAGNCLPACYRCNASKGSRTLEEWVDSSRTLSNQTPLLNVELLTPTPGVEPWRRLAAALEWLRSRGREP